MTSYTSILQLIRSINGLSTVASIGSLSEQNDDVEGSRPANASESCCGFSQCQWYLVWDKDGQCNDFHRHHMRIKLCKRTITLHYHSRAFNLVYAWNFWPRPLGLWRTHGSCISIMVAWLLILLLSYMISSAVEAHCYAVDFGQIDLEQIYSRINNNWLQDASAL